MGAHVPAPSMRTVCGLTGLVHPAGLVWQGSVATVVVRLASRQVSEPTPLRRMYSSAWATPPSAVARAPMAWRSRLAFSRLFVVSTASEAPTPVSTVSSTTTVRTAAPSSP